VVVGNEAVWSRLSDPEQDLVPRLLGMDLLRLGLERGNTARAALTAITRLLETHGQGGQCSDIVPDFSYHNSFLIADNSEAWVLETADRLWAAERVTAGCRNISNCLSITTKVDLCSAGLQEVCREKGWWMEKDGQFNWREALAGRAGTVGSGPDRARAGASLLANRLPGFRIQHMAEVVGDH